MIPTTPARFVICNSRGKVVDLAHKFQLRLDRKMVWLQRLLFKILEALGAYATDNQVEYDYSYIDTGPLMDRIYKMRNELMRRNLEPERLLVGLEDYRKLLDTNQPVYLETPLSFDAQIPYYHTFMGLRVTLCPTMSGIVVIPKLEL